MATFLKGLRTTKNARSQHYNHKLSANQRHVQMIEIQKCEEARPGQQLEATQRQRAGHSKNISGKD
eukprot:scaffold141212_cov12-Tisochrysis_lutea.AAC.1